MKDFKNTTHLSRELSFPKRKGIIQLQANTLHIEVNQQNLWKNNQWEKKALERQIHDSFDKLCNLS